MEENKNPPVDSFQMYESVCRQQFADLQVSLKEQNKLTNEIRDHVTNHLHDEVKSIRKLIFIFGGLLVTHLATTAPETFRVFANWFGVIPK